jgi:hypothetical protein
MQAYTFSVHCGVCSVFNVYRITCFYLQWHSGFGQVMFLLCQKLAGARPEFFIGGGADPEAVYSLFYFKNVL